MTEKIRIKEGNYTWISINNPDEKAIAYLKKHYKFHPLDLEDCLSGTQRPKIDEYENYLFMVLHIPVKYESKRQTIKNSDIYIFFSEKYLITLHNDNPTLNKIFENCKKKKKFKEQYLEKGTGYLLYMIIDDLFKSGFNLFNELSKQVNTLEKEVCDEDQSRDMIQEILILKKDVINFRCMIMPQRAIIAQIQFKSKKFTSEKLDVYFDDIVDKIEKLWNNLENLRELVISLQETNESVISHNTNNVIKILTIFSVVMLPLTVITSFYGMNIAELPFAQNPNSFFIILAILTGVAVGMLVYFKYKKWL